MSLIGRFISRSISTFYLFENFTTTKHPSLHYSDLSVNSLNSREILTMFSIVLQKRFITFIQSTKLFVIRKEKNYFYHHTKYLLYVLCTFNFVYITQ